LSAELTNAQRNPTVTSIVLIGSTTSSTASSTLNDDGGNGRRHHFSAGADLTEFGTTTTTTATSATTSATTTSAATTATAATPSQLSLSPSLRDVVRQIESSPKPVVAAIAGACLGGGLEVALACHYRIGTATAACGLPEVHVVRLDYIRTVCIRMILFGRALIVANACFLV
jgi:1,4-dihydroxy-2-naphthoyl-CoA synthase